MGPGHFAGGGAPAPCLWATACRLVPPPVARRARRAAPRGNGRRPQPPRRSRSMLRIDSPTTPPKTPRYRLLHQRFLDGSFDELGHRIEKTWRLHHIRQRHDLAQHHLDHSVPRDAQVIRHCVETVHDLAGQTNRRGHPLRSFPTCLRLLALVISHAPSVVNLQPRFNRGQADEEPTKGCGSSADQ